MSEMRRVTAICNGIFPSLSAKEKFAPIKHLICSSDGSHVYIVSGSQFFHSDDYGSNWVEISRPRQR